MKVGELPNAPEQPLRQRHPSAGCPLRNIQELLTSHQPQLDKIVLVSFGALLFYAVDRITDDLPDAVQDGMVICFAMGTVLLAATNTWLQRQLTRHVQTNDLLHAKKVTLLRQNEELETRIAKEIAHREIAQSRLARAERMEALGKLAGGVAHDFNNLLQIISSSTTLLQPHVPENQRRRLEPITRATERGARVVDQLLTFAQR